MVNNCVVPGCPTKGSSCALDILFKAPRDPILFEAWKCSIPWDLNCCELYHNSYVCSLHFQESDFWYSCKGLKFLKRRAVPSLFDRRTKSPEKCTTKKMKQEKKSKSLVAVIPAPSGPASPEEGSELKEVTAMPQTKTVTPVPSQVQKLHLVCAECKMAVLKPFKIRNQFTILLCPAEECCYPLGADNLYKYLYRNLPSGDLHQCTPSDAPSLEDIVALIASSGK